MAEVLSLLLLVVAGICAAALREQWWEKRCERKSDESNALQVRCRQLEIALDEQERLWGLPEYELLRAMRDSQFMAGHGYKVTIEFTSGSQRVYTSGKRA